MLFSGVLDMDGSEEGSATLQRLGRFVGDAGEMEQVCGVPQQRTGGHRMDRLSEAAWPLVAPVPCPQHPSSAPDSGHIPVCGSGLGHSRCCADIKLM